MSRLRAIGQSRLTPWIGAALAAVGAVALIGFSLVARVSLPDTAAPSPTQVRPGSEAEPGEIVLPSPPPDEESGDAESAPAPVGSSVTEDGLVIAPTSGLDVTSPSIVPVPIDDGLGVRPGSGPLRGPSVNDGGPSAGPSSEGNGNGKGPGWKKDGYSPGSGGGNTVSRDGSSYDRGPKEKVTKPDKSSDHAKGGHGNGNDNGGKRLGHNKTKGKGHSKHGH